MRLIGICILALGILAMPSYAAAACNAACGVTTQVGDDCCRGGSEGQQDDHQEAPDNSKICAVCAIHVAIVASGDSQLGSPQPLIDLVPTLAPSLEAGASTAIFHPPRA